MKILKKHILEINRLLSFGLIRGKGIPTPGQMCVEAAITVALGEEFSDQPSCVHPEVRKAKIALNDCNWPSNKDRAEGMRFIAVAQLGSICLKEDVFKNQLKLNNIRMILPFIIQQHYNKAKDEKLLEWKKKFEQLKKLDDNLWKEFYNNYSYYYNYYSPQVAKQFLLLIANTILQTLKDVKSPGCKYLKWVK